MTSQGYFTRCPECQSGLIHDYSKGEYICQNCGCVVMDQVDDYGPESISTDFEEKSKNTRASGFTSYSLHDFGLRTEIGLGSKDYSGKSIDQHIAEQMNSMRKWHSRIRVATPKERRLSNVLSKINEICSGLSLPKTITETAAMIYRNFENNNDAKGKSILCMAAATIYMACKRCSVVRSLDEIVKAGGTLGYENTSCKLASKYYRMMVMEMGMFGNFSKGDDQKDSNGNDKSFASTQIFSQNRNTSNSTQSITRRLEDLDHSRSSTTVESTTKSTESNVSLLGLRANPDSVSEIKGISPASNTPNSYIIGSGETSSTQSCAITTPTQQYHSYLQQVSIYSAATVAIDHYISKLANNAKIDTKVERLAIDIAHKTSNHFLADGKSPHGLAAAYIYMAAALLGSSLSQVEISEIAGITEVTIRNRCKDILCNFKITIKLKPQSKD
jgi:transcription initiation factor TFIIIB Brf1 subunit/transcription initiation factor TFIIB